LIRKLTSLFCLCLLISCTTVETQEEKQVVDAPAVPAEPKPVAVADGIDEPPAQTTPYFTREPVSQSQAPQNSIRKGTGVFVREAADIDDASQLYAINLFLDTKPYSASDLPDHDAFLSYRAYIVPFEKAGKTMYRLRLGFFKGYSVAKAVQSELQAYFPSAWIAEVSLNEKNQSLKSSISEPVTAIEESIAEVGDITLNFEAADLREFVRVVFEDILKQNYLIDPQVKGKVTLHTTDPIMEDALLPIVEAVLQQNGAAVVLQQGIFKIVTLEDAPTQADSSVANGGSVEQGAGYTVQIVPLRYVSASEIEKIITPLVPKGASVRVLEARNLLILSGPSYRIKQMLGTIKTFDVDWLKGMSFGLFRLQYAEASMLISELENLFGTGAGTPLAGIVKLMPIEQLNAILVVTHAPRYMDEVSKLISQFDLGTEGPPGSRLFVYHLKNSKAENIASTLQQIYGISDGAVEAAPSAKITQLPPGEAANVFQTAEAVSSQPRTLGAGTGAGGDYPRTAPLTGPDAGKRKPPASTGTRSTQADLSTQSMINIIADQDSNAILVMASPRDYRGIEAVIKQLDAPQRQVLIEATIAEVTLSDALDYGVRWFLANGTYEVGFNAPVPTSAGGDGLTVAAFSTSNDARMFIDLLASETEVKFLSAPQVMVLDNHTANIRVGDQIPVTVRSSQSTTNPDSPVVSEVQFRDTGTLLSVTPRINAGGQVTLEISQEVSLPGSEPAVGGGGNVAISQRTINSSVVVQSGQTIVIGGLILETQNQAKAGIPLLMDIPWLGNLFSVTSVDVFRTELIVMITPQVVVDEAGTQAIHDDMRIKMKKVIEWGKTVESSNL
jgi:general secretion pathway protein D